MAHAAEVWLVAHAHSNWAEEVGEGVAEIRHLPSNEGNHSLLCGQWAITQGCSPQRREVIWICPLRIVPGVHVELKEPLITVEAEPVRRNGVASGTGARRP